jgi:hypothetical protein
MASVGTHTSYTSPLIPLLGNPLTAELTLASMSVGFFCKKSMIGVSLLAHQSGLLVPIFQAKMSVIIVVGYKLAPTNTRSLGSPFNHSN